MNPSNQIDRAKKASYLGTCSYVARSRSSDHGPYMYTLQTVHVESVTTHVDLD